eukprot:scaffold116654_cov60-Phaeocystis_antarctica.AAC.4
MRCSSPLSERSAIAARALGRLGVNITDNLREPRRWRGCDCGCGRAFSQLSQRGKASYRRRRAPPRRLGPTLSPGPRPRLVPRSLPPRARLAPRARRRARRPPPHRRRRRRGSSLASWASWGWQPCR